MNISHNVTLRNFKVFLVFVKRDMKVLRSIIKDMLINGAFFVTLQTLLYVYLLPVMGMPAERILPLFLGIVILLMSMIGFHKSFRIMNDRDKSKFIEYQLSLLPKKWLFAEYAFSFCIEFAFQAIIPFAVCAVLIGPGFNVAAISWTAFFAIVCASLLFFSTFFLAICMVLPAYWFFDNLWPRILTPMILLGTANYPLERVRVISPLLGKLFLLNPVTYVIEGLRGALAPGSTPISLALCVTMLISFMILNLIILSVGVRSTLDPV